MRLNLRQRLLLLGLLPVLLCGSGIGALYAGLLASAESGRWVTHTAQVIASANGLFADALTAQSSRRGYAMSEDRRLVAVHDRAVRDFSTHASQLRELVSDNSLQQTRAKRIEDRFFTWARVDLQSATNVLDDGTIDDIRDAFRVFVEEEQRLLVVRSAGLEQATIRARLIAMLAPGVAFALALVVSWTIGRQISGGVGSVVSAAEGFAAGDLKRRATLQGGTGDDQLAALARGFNRMADTLAERDGEAELLQRLSEFLLAAKGTDEASAVIALMMNEIFPSVPGALYVADSSRAQVEPVAHWGTMMNPKPFAIDQCWALRRGQVHDGLVNPGALGCEHVDDGVSDYYCVPLVAQGEALSIVHLRPQSGLAPAERRRLTTLAHVVAERIAMALSNLRLRDSLRAQSIRDSLTGLFNRRYLEETLVRELSRARRTRTSVAVIVLDIDHFKRFNDSFGHVAGDVVLREVGAVLAAGVRKEDIACRYGGEEFVLVLPSAGLADAVARAEHLRAAIKSIRASHQGQALGTITASFGAATFPEQGDSSDVLINAADEALYRAKQAGRDRVETVTPLAAAAKPLVA